MNAVELNAGFLEADFVTPWLAPTLSPFNSDFSSSQQNGSSSSSNWDEVHDVSCASDSSSSGAMYDAALYCLQNCISGSSSYSFYNDQSQLSTPTKFVNYGTCEAKTAAAAAATTRRSSGSDSGDTHKAKKRRRVVTPRQRVEANGRERRRMTQLNAAFNSLRCRVPIHAYERRPSRIDTLRLATDYIAFMTECLAKTDSILSVDCPEVPRGQTPSGDFYTPHDVLHTM